MSTAMEQIHHIRELYYEQGKNISAIADEVNMNWRTVQKYVDKEDFNLPKPKAASDYVLCPKLDPYKPDIDQWLQDDKKAPRKQRHTARRVFHRLLKEKDGFDCSYRLVAEYVAVMKKELHLGKQEGRLPLIHYPGEAQADFGSADFYETGQQRSGKYLVVSFPYSNAGYVQLKYGENMEALLECLRSIFEHIGGVPKEIWFDNTRTIVTKIIKGGDRNTTERFNHFREHYGFKPVFMNPNAGWEKGSVENKVGYDRRNMLVPVPRFLNLADFNAKLLVDCDNDSEREHYRVDSLISTLYEEDKRAFLPLPSIPFDTAYYRDITTNSWGKFYLNKGLHEYSVSPAYPTELVNLKLTSETVTVMDSDMNEIITHPRLYGDTKQESMEWLPYLKYIARRPRSLKNSGIYGMMPTDMQSFMDKCQSSERGKILKVLSDLTDKTGFDSALQTVNQAILYQSHDADSLESLYRRLFSNVPELPPMDHPSIPHVDEMTTNLVSYDALLAKRGVVNG